MLLLYTLTYGEKAEFCSSSGEEARLVGFTLQVENMIGRNPVRCVCVFLTSFAKEKSFLLNAKTSLEGQVWTLTLLATFEI